MAEPIQNIEAVRIGHFRLELGLTEGTLRNIGAANDGMLKYITEVTSIEFDNTGEVLQVVDDETIEITASLGEISIPNMDIVNSGLGTVEDTAASPLSITDEPHVMTDTDAIRLVHKMGVRGEVTAVTITVGGTPAVRNTDYVMDVDQDGYSTIARIAASAVMTDNCTALVDYTYTPLASKKISFGGKGVLDYLVARITHVKKGSNPELGWSFLMPKVKIQGGFELKFPPVKKTAPMLSPIKLTAIKDTSKAVGKQLIEIVDTQNPSGA